MKTVRLTKVIKLSILKGAHKDRLVRFFNIFSGQLRAVKVEIPDPAQKDAQFYRALLKLLKTPDRLPLEVTEALMLIEDLAEQSIVDGIQVEAVEKGIVTAFKASTYLDVLLDLYVDHNGFLIRKHREIRALLLTSFDFYAGKDRSAQPLPLPHAEACRRFEAALNPWFEKHGRGVDALVDPWQMDGQLWFQISHGDPLLQTGVIKDHRRKVERFQPDKDDVIVYDLQANELRASARTPGERNLYARAFGLTFFGSEKYFAKVDKFTFAPLCKGASSLNFRKYPDLAAKLQSVHLTYLAVNYGSPTPGIVAFKSNNVFETLRLMNLPLHPEHEILKAAFTFTTKAHPSKPRTFRLSTKSRLTTSRMSDQDLARLFFHQMGFLIGSPAAESEPDNAAPIPTGP